MRIATFNIHKGIGGVDRHYRPDRLINLLRHLEADVLLLQEVDHGARRTDYHHQSRIIADAVGMPHVAVGLNHKLRGPGAYGNVTISRHPIISSGNIDLSRPLKKKRGALYTQIDLPGLGPTHVYNFHLGLIHFERVSQVRQILSLPALAEDPASPAIIAGDSNDWRGRLCRKWFEPQGFVEAGQTLLGQRHRTFPAFRPLFSLDRVYYRNIAARQLVDVDHNDLLHASDHRPVLVEFSSPQSETTPE